MLFYKIVEKLLSGIDDPIIEATDPKKAVGM